jgi:murein DD-endopeptidase MepM/ murein hydrolase activator NlpD
LPVHKKELMVEESTAKKIIKKIKDQYRLIIYNDTSFQTVWSIKLSGVKFFSLVGLVSTILIVLGILIIAATGLKEFIPGYPKADYRQMLLRNRLRVDSLEQEIARRDAFFKGIKSIISGEVPKDDSIYETEHTTHTVDFKKFNHDSVFQDKILAEQLSLTSQTKEGNPGLGQLHFFVPVKGIITNRFNSMAEHFGVDLVSEPNARISSILDGTVIFSGWTLETGYVIYIQHKYDLISVYKHNSQLLKNIGDNVKVGETIALIGNTGELSTGPHLHFEMWYNGAALNPEEYIDF